MNKMDPSKEYIDLICRLYGDSYDDREEDSSPSGLDWSPGKTAQHKSLSAFKRELEEIYDIKLSNSKILKILITGGCWSTERTREVGYLYETMTTPVTNGGEGMEKKATVKRIADELEISQAMVCMSLPYGRTVYDLEDKSSNAVRCSRWRNGEKAQSLKALKDNPNSDNLWRCICLYQGERLRTSGRGSKLGVSFTYRVSAPGGAGGRHYDGKAVDGYGNELLITTLPSGEQKKKSISRSTVDLGLEKVLKMDGRISGPRTLNVPGAHSYLFAIFSRFGLIKMGELG